MKKKIVTLGAVCALLLTACGKAGQGVQTSGNGNGSPEPPQAPGKIQVEQVEDPVITVSSRESVKVAPDIAEIVYGVTTQDKDAAQCQSENDRKVGQLVETLKALGMEENSIQTSRFDMDPRYDWDQGGVIIGYEATTQVIVSDIQLEQAGTVMEKSVEAGVDQIQSVSFLSSHYDEEYQEALKGAVAQAQEKAQALADASGCTLGRPVHIEEHLGNDSYRYGGQNMERSAGAMKYEATADAAAVMPGEIEIEAEITVDYAIQ